MRIVRCDGDPIWGEGEEGADWRPRPFVFDSLGFAANYEVEEVPGAGEAAVASVVHPRKWKDLPPDPENTVVLSIRPRGGAAVRGAFRAEYRCSGFAEGLFGSPDPDCLLVCVGNFLWRVPVADPEAAEVISNYPTAIVALPEYGCVVVAENSTLVAFGPRGPRWESVEIAMDGFRLLEVEGTVLKGTASHSGQKWPEAGLPYRADLLTGEVWGGWTDGEVPLDAPRGAPAARRWPA